MKDGIDEVKIKKTNKSEESIAISMLGINSKDEYQEKIEYGLKQFFIFKRNYPSLPGDVEFSNNLVSQALIKAVFTYDNTMGTEFNTHFYNKIRGEVTTYVKKQETTQRYANKLVASGEIAVRFTENGYESETITEGSIDDILIAEEEYRRKMTATSMSKSELPMKLQRVLYAVLEYDKLKNAADVLDMEVADIKQCRDHALSLILKKVLRSKHLTEEEKDEMKKDYALI